MATPRPMSATRYCTMKETSLISVTPRTSRNVVGMAAAAGFYQSIVGFIVVLIANGIVRKVSSENALF